MPTKKNEIDKLEKIQFAAIRYSMGYRISTPTNILIAESKLMYIKDRSKYLCHSYLLKVLSNKNLPIYKKIHQYHSLPARKKKRKRKKLLLQCIEEIIPATKAMTTQQNYNIYLTDYETLTSSIECDIELGQILKDSTAPNSIIDDYIEQGNAIAIFTDGSKIQNASSVGAACSSDTLNVTVKKAFITMLLFLRQNVLQ